MPETWLMEEELVPPSVCRDESTCMSQIYCSGCSGFATLVGVISQCFQSMVPELQDSIPEDYM